jgi:glucose-1-phosphate cytidylyltransferase
MTGGRIRRVARHIGNQPFMLTYGDGVTDLNIAEVVEFHKKHGKLASVTATQPMERFGVLNIGASADVTAFHEKPKGDGSWVSGGFFVLDPRVLDRIDGDQVIFEKAPMERLAAEGELMAFKHTGFWYAMDTVRDRNYLEELWAAGKAPWKVWK